MENQQVLLDEENNQYEDEDQENLNLQDHFLNNFIDNFCDNDNDKRDNSSHKINSNNHFNSTSKDEQKIKNQFVKESEMENKEKQNSEELDEEQDKENKNDNANIDIEDNKIVKIGNNLDLSCDKIIDASGKVVMPGLINTHAHVPMSIFRESMEGYTLQDWLSKKIWPMEAKLSYDDIYWASCLSFLEMIKTGSTCVNDFYFMTDSIIKAMFDTGVRLQTTSFVMDTLGYEDGKYKLDMLKEAIVKWKDNPNVTLNVGIHALSTTSDEYLNQLTKKVKGDDTTNN